MPTRRQRTRREGWLETALRAGEYVLGVTIAGGLAGIAYLTWRHWPLWSAMLRGEMP